MTRATERILCATLRADSTVAEHQIARVLAQLRNATPAEYDGQGLPLLLSQAQTARRLGCSRFTIRRLEKQGRLKAVHLTPRYRKFRRADVEALAAQ